MHDYLTTKETADLLRIKERKLYELCAAGELPVTKVTGKLIFPREALLAWLRRNTDYGRNPGAVVARPPVIAGSHDPLLDWALRACGCGLATYFDGSADGLERVRAARAVAAGIHFHGGEAANAERIARDLPGEPVVLVRFARRRQGLVFRKDGGFAPRLIGDIAGHTVVLRQAGSGARALFDALVNDAGLGASDYLPATETARSELDIALAVATGHGDTGLAVEAAARQHNLGFLPLAEENFDLVIWRRDAFEEPLQKLLDFCRTPQFAERAGEMGGYDVSGFGAILHNG